MRPPGGSQGSGRSSAPRSPAEPRGGSPQLAPEARPQALHLCRSPLQVPVPEGESWTSRVLASLNPSHWFSRPMLMVPMYVDAEGGLRAAPVAVTQLAPLPGFEVTQLAPRPRILRLTSPFA